MDDRQHADLANSIRDAIGDTWPLHGMNTQRLRTIISSEISLWRNKHDNEAPHADWQLVFKCLFERYREMTKDTELKEFCELSIQKIDKFPLSKINRWLGYVQGTVIAEGCTTVEKERNYTRPLFKLMKEIETW